MTASWRLKLNSFDYAMHSAPIMYYFGNRIQGCRSQRFFFSNGITTAKKISHTDRYRPQHDDEKRDYSLTILNAQPKDSGEYK
ncbi:hypothetical protein OSTOST_25238 [Ostertagia ostertagi]